MGTFTRGDIVVASLSYSDLSGSKRRPALVVAVPDGLDPVLCLITSQSRGDSYEIVLKKTDFASGGLNIDSNVRVCHLFTVAPKIIDYKVGRLKPKKLKEVTDKIIEMLNE